PQDGGDARLSFVATVTDPAEQKQTRSTDRLVTTRPVRVEAIPEGGKLVVGLANQVHVLVSRADGTPVSAARVSITEVARPVVTDAGGGASFTYTPRANSVSWTIRVTDPGGEVLARRHDQLECSSAAVDFLVRTDRAVYRAGQTMKLTALGAGSEPVFLDF